MKKYLTIVITIVAMTCFGFATTWGPDFIKSIYYDSKHHSIWYIKEYYDWEWWIKIIEYLVKSHKTKTITNIGGIQHESDNNGRIYDITSEEAQKVLIKQWFKELQAVYIDKMPLYFTLTPHHYEIYRDDGLTTYISDTPKSGMYRVNWSNKIYINNQLQNITNITTCGLDPINYRWLSLPWTNFMTIIASSEKRDCDEYGYIGEELFVVRYLRMHKRYFLWPHSDLYRKIFEDNQNKWGHYGNDWNYYETHDYFGESWPFKTSIWWLYTDTLKYNKENIIKKK